MHGVYVEKKQNTFVAFSVRFLSNNVHFNIILEIFFICLKCD
jgi:hypothetical protein